MIFVDKTTQNRSKWAGVSLGFDLREKKTRDLGQSFIASLSLPRAGGCKVSVSSPHVRLQCREHRPEVLSTSFSDVQG